MRTVTIKNNEVVIEIEGIKVKYSLDLIRKRIVSILLDLDKWKEYELLLTTQTPGLEIAHSLNAAFTLINTYINEYPHCICSDDHKKRGEIAPGCVNCNNIDLFNAMVSWKNQCDSNRLTPYND